VEVEAVTEGIDAPLLLLLLLRLLLLLELRLQLLELLHLSSRF